MAKKKKLVLEEAASSKKSSWALAAANIRRELRHRWPDAKFRVRSDSYAGGCSVHVEWTDGPPSREVAAIARRYQYGEFDAMTDMYEHNRNFDDRYGSAKYVLVSRNYSPEAMRLAAEAVDARIEEKEGYGGSIYLAIPDFGDERRVYDWLDERDLRDLEALPLKEAS